MQLCTKAFLSGKLQMYVYSLSIIIVLCIGLMTSVSSISKVHIQCFCLQLFHYYLFLSADTTTIYLHNMSIQNRSNVIHPKYIKNSNDSCTFFILDRLGCQDTNVHCTANFSPIKSAGDPRVAKHTLSSACKHHGDYMYT